jgi:hypothetical protein
MHAPILRFGFPAGVPAAVPRAPYKLRPGALMFEAMGGPKPHFSITRRQETLSLLVSMYRVSSPRRSKVLMTVAVAKNVGQAVDVDDVSGDGADAANETHGRNFPY